MALNNDPGCEKNKRNVIFSEGQGKTNVKDGLNPDIRQLQAGNLNSALSSKQNLKKETQTFPGAQTHLALP